MSNATQLKCDQNSGRFLDHMVPRNDDRESPTLDAVRALLGEIEAKAEQGEKDRMLVGELVDKMSDAGIFRMLVPKQYGGDNLTALQMNAVIEELATADAAAAWTAMVAVGFNIAMAQYPKATVEQIYANGPDVRMRGAVAPTGKAEKVEGGYRLTGRWPFGSGPFKPEWMFGGAICHENGKPIMGANGPLTCLALVPAEEFEFFDTWYTVGLCATDSRDFAVNDVFVPDSHVINLFDFGNIKSSFDDKLFKLPFPLIAGPTHSSVCLGILRATLTELADLSKVKKSAFRPGQILSDSEVFQFNYSDLCVRYASLDALHVQQLRELDGLSSGAQNFAPQFHIPRAASWVGYIHQETTKIMNQVVELAGSAPVYSKSQLQKRWRDARIVAQHNAGMRSPYAPYGMALAKS